MRVVTADETETVFAFLKDAAAWLREKNVDYWQNWLNPPKEHRDWVETGIRNHEFYVVETNDGPVGMFRLQFEDELFWGTQRTPAGYLHSFTVKRTPECRGLGSAILGAVEELLRAEGIDVLRLDCGTHVEGLVAYYLRHGFVAVGETDVGGEHLVLLEKTLSPPHAE